MSVVEKMSYENARLMLEQVGNGCTSGSFAEWPQLRPACRSILARLDALQADRDELHGRLLESSKRLLEIKADKDALQAVADKLKTTKDGVYIIGPMTLWKVEFIGVVECDLFCSSDGWAALPASITDAKKLNYPEWCPTACYSTRAAAEAAMKEQQDADV